ncbi:MAG TPA: efflux transporter outer membrane subunit [Cyclobacteriaceae bacterium]|nr:efflux transporter outer membrane subunit [Cyclobacteriaceae bacterium]
MMRLRYIFCLSITGFLAGCKMTAPQYPVAKTLPDSFGVGAADTSKSIAAIPLREFFNDPFLNDLITTTLHENLDLKIAMQRITMVQAGIRLGRGALLPSFNGVVSAGQKRFGDYTMDAIGNYDTNFSENIREDQKLREHMPDYYAGLQSSWEIDVWGKLRNYKRAALSRFLASEKGKLWVTTSLVAEVASLYYELLALDNEIEIINKNIVLQERALEVIQVQKTAGRANELGVKQVAAQLFNTKSLQARIRQEIIEVENHINMLQGRYPQVISRGKPIMEQNLPNALKIGIPAKMLTRRPDVQQAEYEFIATKADVRAARAAFFPSLTITSAFGLQSFNASHLIEPGSLAYSFLGGLTAPLFNKNKIRSDYQVANASGMEAFYRYQKVTITAYQEVVNNLTRIENFGEVAEYKKDEVEALNNAVSASNDLFATSFASYLEVITAQRSVLEAELNLATIRKEQFHAIISLYKSVGGGWE